MPEEAPPPPHLQAEITVPPELVESFGPRIYGIWPSLSREEKLAVLDHQKTRSYAGSRCLYPALFDPGNVLRWIDPALLKVFAG